MAHSISFELNGKPVVVTGVSSNTSLLDWLRAQGRTGTKEGCAEGDCGACSVALRDVDGRGKPTWRAVNACLTLMPMLDGRSVVTVEGMAEGGLHPVQEAMVARAGSQCGYCTPGFIASMFEGYYRDGLTTPAQVSDQLCGNLCRCTGYRPIRDAMADALAAPARAQPDRFRLPLAAPAPLPESAFHNGAEVYLQPDSLDALLALRAAHPEAALIAGATEIGVEINKKFKHFGLLISTERVAALRAIEATDDRWRIGGAATLTALEEALGGEYPALDKMLWVFASRQIRNRATLAGNLVTASPIGDLAPVMLSLDAELELASVRGVRRVPIADFFVAYRKTVLAPDEVLSAVYLARGPSAPGLTRRFDTFKVSKRRELDIAIVSASFVVDTDENLCIRHARLAYGGVAATPVRARAVEAALLGQRFERATFEAVRGALGASFAPIDDVRSGRLYRRRLVVSLFEKFFEGAQSAAQDLPLRYLTTPPQAEPAGSKALRHESAEGHVSGQARYVDDVAERRAMLELWPVMAPHAHAQIVHRDAARARAMPGVRAVLMAEDVPGLNDVGAIRHDEVLLPRDLVSFEGQPVAVVVADSYAQARAAAAAVEIRYAPLPPVLGLADAIAAASYHTAGHTIRRGDVTAALAASPHRLAGSLDIGGQEHFYLETQAAWAEVGESGEVFVSSSTQHPSEVQAIVAHVLGLGRHQVTVESPRMGGGFGGKETQGAYWAALAALGAQKTGSPVRVQLDRDLDMRLTGKRHPFFAQYEVGFDDAGHLTALRASLTSDGGWALDLSESICDRALFHIDNSYYIAAVEVHGRVARTNTVSHTAFRGFGGPQGMVVIEEIIDRVARTLGLAPELVRARNLYRGEGETATTHYGQAIVDNRLDRIWASLIRSSDFEARRAEVAAFNAKSPKIKRGLAITPVKFGISFTASFLNQAGAYLLVYRDGTLQVNHGGTEMGQGLHTKILGVVMRELGLSREKVRMMKTATDKVPNTSATAASAGADLNGAAVQDACATLRGRLLPVAAALLGTDAVKVRLGPAGFETLDGGARVSFEATVEKAYFQQISLAATGYYRTPEIHYDKARGQGRPFHYFAFGAAVAEVEVDGYSGMKKVLRVDIVHDVGDSLNPGVDRGQIEGGFVQGMGWLTAEELRWDAKGALRSHSASTYQIPSFGDAPEDFRVTLLPDAAQAGTIHGSKAVGEPPLMLAMAVREAIRDAVGAFGAGRGPIDLGCPSTHEAIASAIDAQTTLFTE
ncbi:MAG: xanthine dehydrogenase molybdopterin binding subunit [Myxococcales bacterium]|nr:xanthine dehydrogenase molybdopterin binding subunit [Myxococcales bacterium]